MKGSHGHPRGRSSPSKVHKAAISSHGSTAHHEEGQPVRRPRVLPADQQPGTATPRSTVESKGKGKAIEPGVALGSTPLEAQAVQDRRGTPLSARKKSLGGRSTASRASGTTGKTSEAGSKGYVLSTDVKAYIKQLAQEEKEDEAHNTRVALKPVSSLSPQLDAFGKLLEKRDAHQDHVLNPSITPTIDDRKNLATLEKLFLRKWFLATLCVALVSLVAVSAAVFLFITSRRAPHVASPNPLLAGIRPACTSKECKSALEILNMTMDESVDPCRDSYALACGRWKFVSELGEPVTYKGMLYRRYVWKAHMVLAANSTETQPDMYVPSQLYRSCISFLAEARARLLEVWNASGIEPTRWLDVSNHSELFSLIVDTQMANGLESVFLIQKGKPSVPPVVATGRSMKTDALNPDHAIKELLKEADRVVNIPIGEDWAVVVDDISTLDADVHKITWSRRHFKAETTVGASDLDNEELGVHWAPMLRMYARADHTKAPDVVTDKADDVKAAPDVVAVKVNDVEAVKSLVSLMGRAPLTAATLYTMLVPVAEFMSVEYNVTTQRGRMRYGYRRRTCLYNVYRFLREPFAWLLARTVQANGTVHVASRMWESLKHVGDTMRTIAVGLQLSDMTLMHYNLVAEGDGNYNLTQLFAREYGDSFISNLVIHVRLTGRRVSARSALNPHREYPAFVPTVYLIPDFFYPTVEVSSVNYGTLGVHMAQMMFNQSVPSGRLQRHKECFGRYARRLGLLLSGGSIARALRTRWAAEVALQAWRNEQPGMSQFLPFTQLFFLRFAIMYCGTKRSQQAAMQFATRSLPSYAVAFNCSDPPPVPC